MVFPKATEFWSESNIADGLNALTICVEVCFLPPCNTDELNHMDYRWYSSRRLCYGPTQLPLTSKMVCAPASGAHSGIVSTSVRLFTVLQVTSLIMLRNIADFAIEMWSSLKFFIDYLRGKPGTHTPKGKKTDFVQAFGTTGKNNIADSSTKDYNDVESGVPFDSGLMELTHNANSNRGERSDEKEETVRLMQKDVDDPQLASSSVSESALDNVVEITNGHTPYDPPQPARTY